jgi:hypothetical protein
MKTCTKCRRMFPANAYNFHRDRARKGGLHPWCIVCRKGACAEQKRRIRSDRERMARVAETAARWKAANRAKINAAYRARYAEMTPEERQRKLRQSAECRRATKAYRRRNSEEKAS